MNTAEDRSDEWHALASVRASLDQYVDLAVGGACIGVRTGSGTIYAYQSHGAGDVMVLRFGRGGGFCWERRWPRRDLDRYLKSLADRCDLEVCRGDSDILPAGYRP